MQMHERTDDMQPEAHPALIHTAGTVALVEAVEKAVELLARDARAGVSDRRFRHAAVRVVGNGDRPVFGGEFDRVFDQVVNDLRNHILVALDKDRIGIKSLDLDVLFLKAAGKFALLLTSLPFFSA